MKLKSLLTESSAPVTGASFVGEYESQSTTYQLWVFRVGNFRVYVATTENGNVAHHGKGPWLWDSERDAKDRIAKWR